MAAEAAQTRLLLRVKTAKEAARTPTQGFGSWLSPERPRDFNDPHFRNFACNWLPITQTARLRLTKPMRSAIRICAYFSLSATGLHGTL